MTATAALPAPKLSPFVAQPLAWLLALTVAHVLVRVALSPALKWDEAEQMLWSQQLSLGYGAQPPLYTWLQWGVNQVFGPSVLALSLLKHSLLALAYMLMWLAARELLGPRSAWWVAASLMLLPPLGWYSIRDQTHTILVAAMTCAAWWLLLRSVRRPGPANFAWLGLVCALGLLAKYSFALVIAAMLLAALSVPTVRRALFAPGWWWALVVGTLVVLPHGLWLLAHLGEATSGTLSKMQIQPQAQYGKGLLSLLDMVAGMLGLWALIAWLSFGKAWWRKPVTPAAPWAQQVFVRYLVLMVLALVGMVLFAGVTNFKGRWAVPLLCVVPLAAFAARPELAQHPKGGRFTAITLGVIALMLVAGGVRPWISALRGDVDELNHPAAALGTALQQAGVQAPLTIVGADHMIAGTLRTRFTQAHVVACGFPETEVGVCLAEQVRQAEAAGRGWLVLSRDDRGDPRWWDMAAKAVPDMAVHTIQLPFRMVREGVPPATYRYSWHPSPQSTAPQSTAPQSASSTPAS
ncbi:ArnT family glycosyltransferase [Ottowia sp.]|uniref:ArnT family glycosyltransferase n=1 Tax=Ottowia sp. TaxID=1898956 RepID=UPI003A877D03